MKKKEYGVLGTIVAIGLLLSGLFTDFINFFFWLLMLNFSGPALSLVGNIVVRIVTFVISFLLVGLIFKTLGLKSDKLEKLFQFVISSLLGFGLSYVVMVLEQHIVVVGIVFGCALVILLIVFICLKVKKKRQENDKKITI